MEHQKERICFQCGRDHPELSNMNVVWCGQCGKMFCDYINSECFGNHEHRCNIEYGSGLSSEVLDDVGFVADDD